MRGVEARVLDVAVACGFKTQQHFARVFRRVCGASPTEYRQEFLHHGATCALEPCPYDTPTFAATASTPQTPNTAKLRPTRTYLERGTFTMTSKPQKL
jgi:hypothetical protein